MKEIIKKIIDIDRKAQLDFSDAKKKAENMILEAENVRRERFEENDQGVDGEIEDIKQEFAVESKKQVAEILKRQEESIAHLSKAMGDNRGRWKREILSRVTDARS